MIELQKGTLQIKGKKGRLLIFKKTSYVTIHFFFSKEPQVGATNSENMGVLSRQKKKGSDCIRARLERGLIFAFSQLSLLVNCVISQHIILIILYIIHSSHNITSYPERKPRARRIETHLSKDDDYFEFFDKL